MNVCKVLLVSLGLGFAGMGYAELDPELAELSAGNKNSGGLAIGADVGFGQSQAVTTSRAGAALSVMGEVTYVIPRGSWNRLEGGLEFGFGNQSFKAKGGQKEDIDVQVGLALLAKFGYGYSMGGFATMVWHVGVGTALLKYSAEDNGLTAKTDQFSALVGQLGGKFLFPVNDGIDFAVGIDRTHYQFDIDEVEVNGVSSNGPGAVNVNETTVSIGGRIKL